MKKCLACHAIFQSIADDCSHCGFGPEQIDGFPAYAPAFIHESAGFKASYFEQLASLEAKNFWFCARNRLIIWALKHYYPQCRSFLEIGCGTGFVLSSIADAFANLDIQGSEIFTAGLSFAASRVPTHKLMQMDARHIPFIEEFDCIGAFDVLEHIEEDTQVLEQIHQALNQRGMLFLTVPQHPWLWSPVDDHACHVRRYSAKGLHAKLKGSGFKILRSTSFVTSLLPVMLISRLIQTVSFRKAVKPNAGLDISPRLNFIFEKILDVEIYLIKNKINFPMGGSRFVIAQKL